MVDFAVQCSGQVASTNEMIHKMQNCYKEVTEYFTFDASKYPIEALFTDIEIFKESFSQAYKEILNVRKKQPASIRNKVIESRLPSKVLPKPNDMDLFIKLKEIGILVVPLFPYSFAKSMLHSSKLI